MSQMQSKVNLQVPPLLNIPEKMFPLIVKANDYDNFLIDGGRGSGKSQTVARFLLYIGCIGKARIVCGREIQETIEESVHALLKDLIQEYNLDYEVFQNKIVHRKTGTVFLFKGFREQGKVNIKGLEGATILWVDEAQAITSNTLKIIIPTIRKDKSKVIFTMNRYLENDPVFEEYSTRKDTLHIHIDYFENKFCPEKLLKEANICKERDIEDYGHIWLGQPLRQSAKAAFRNVWSCVNFELLLPIDPVPHFNYVLGVDLAKSFDNTALVVLCIETKEVVYFERMESENKTSWNYQKLKIKAVSEKYNNALTVPDSTGLGDPITEDLRSMGCNVFVDTTGDKESNEVAGFKFTNMSKRNIVEKLKVAIELQLIKLPNISVLINELVRFEATRMPSGQIRYSAPEGKDEFGRPLNHDDCVIALALALWGTRSMIYDQEYEEKKEISATDEFWSIVRKDIVSRNIENNSLQADNIMLQIDCEDAEEISDDNIIDLDNL